MGNFFTPPVAPVARRFYTGRENHPAYDLFRHVTGAPIGINLWIVGGVVTTDEPQGPLAADDVEFLGSHLYWITDAQAALLTAAGYGASITTGIEPPPGTGFTQPAPYPWDPNIPPDPGLHDPDGGGPRTPDLFTANFEEVFV